MLAAEECKVRKRTCKIAGGQANEAALPACLGGRGLVRTQLIEPALGCGEHAKAAKE
jgi:hypothetical protein